jgi:hypothetical protein
MPSWEIIASTCMGIENLSAKEQDVAFRCLKATAAHLDDWEKHSRLGLEADELQQVIVRWPNIDDRDEGSSGFLAINNCMNEVCHGFRIAPEEWEIWFDMPMSEIESTYRKWIALKGASGGIR